MVVIRAVSVPMSVVSSKAQVSYPGMGTVLVRDGKTKSGHIQNARSLSRFLPIEEAHESENTLGGFVPYTESTYPSTIHDISLELSHMNYWRNS